MADLSSLFQGLLGVGATTLLNNDGIQAAEQVGEDALALAQQSSADSLVNGQFTPFSVTSGSGAVDTMATDGAFSGLNLNLPPELQALAAAMQGAAGDQTASANVNTFDQTQGMLTSLGLGGPGRSEQDIFNLLNQVQIPEQERERLALEQRLFNQGRSGVRTAQYGGTPEELAIAKAREEARSGTAVDAFNLAREDDDRRFSQFSGLFDRNLADREVSGNLASNFLQSSFLPTDDLRRTATLGADVASIDQQARTQAGGYSAGLLETGIEGSLEANVAATQARIARNQDLVNLLLGSTNEADVRTDGLFDTVGDIIGDYF